MKCGSRRYGSSELASGGWIRNCHGDVLLPGGGSMPCKYRWPKAEDYAHFERDDGRGFASPEEHQLAWEQWVARQPPLVAQAVRRPVD